MCKKNSTYNFFRFPNGVLDEQPDLQVYDRGVKVCPLDNCILVHVAPLKELEIAF